MRDGDQSGTPDQRRAPRVETSMTGVVAGTSRTDIKCRISNVSRIGACAISETAFPEMAHVKIRFQVDEPPSPGRTIACEAAVVRSQRRPDGQYDLGLFFTSIRAEDREVLDRLVAKGMPIVTG